MEKKLPDNTEIRYMSIIDQPDFVLGVEQLRKIHEKLFADVYQSAGKFRNTNVVKREIILNGDTIPYSDCRKILPDMVMAILSQYNLDYNNMPREEVVKNISKFTADIWKVHPFDDGNTRAIYLFIHRYLRSLGYDISLEIFKNNSTYFRNALVKAVYENPEFYIKSDIGALENFFRKCLVDNKIELNIDDVYVDGIVKFRKGINR